MTDLSTPAEAAPREPATRPTDRLFFAVYPDEAGRRRAVETALALKQAQGLRGRPLAPERLHVTLQFLGDHVGLPQAMVEAACRAAGRVGCRAFDIEFDHVASFSGRRHRRPLVLRGDSGLAGVQALHRALAQALVAERVSMPDTRPFTPHLTLLYDDQQVADQPVPRIGWRVTEFALMRSIIGRAQHVALARWSLPE